ncbi:MAG: hypothetical protein R3E42_17360 [Burkholderiaceae bacterium]
MTFSTTPMAAPSGAFALPEPSNDPAAPLVMRLAREFGATWVDETTVAEWVASGGDRSCCWRAMRCGSLKGRMWPPCCRN